jgi:hypothetical protein
LEGKLLQQLGDHFIGLWRYNVYGERRYWVCTICVHGEYFDSDQRTSPTAALREANRVLSRALKDPRPERKKRRS